MNLLESDGFRVALTSMAIFGLLFIGDAMGPAADRATPRHGRPRHVRFGLVNRKARNGPFAPGPAHDLVCQPAGR